VESLATQVSFFCRRPDWLPLLHLGEQLLPPTLVDVADVTTVAPLHLFVYCSVRLYRTFYILLIWAPKRFFLGKFVEHKDSFLGIVFETGRTSAYNYKPHLS
jgi:hypothetical protein